MASSPIQKSGATVAASHTPPRGGQNLGRTSSFPEDDPCTDRCRSKEHGRKIWEIALGGENVEVVCLWAKTCLNYANVKDEFGRTALHAAASTGNVKAVEWLIKTQQCNINAKDFISGYTALHRSIYFGHLHVARSLIKNGADVNVRDNEGLTPFELCQMDRPKLFRQNRGDMTELTVWGSNANYNLGLGHQQPRLHPDVVPEFRRPEMSLTKIEMNTYHTVFLTQRGKVYACGYGMGGRLGTGDEEVVLHPSLVQLRNNGPCRDIAVGQDHTIFLTDTKVWTVGSNEFGQLGQPQLHSHLKNPRTVDSLQKYEIKGILAGNFHSCFYNSETILMCGQNLGQFGKGFEEQTTVAMPSKLRLTLDNVGNGTITNVGGNEYCTAVCIERRHVLLIRRNQCLRIDSRSTTSQEIVKLQASGEKNNIALFMLTASGRVLVWRENLSKSINDYRGAFTRLVFSSNRLLDVKDFCVSQSSLVVITSTGEAYKTGWNCGNPPTIVGRMEERYGQVAAADFQIALRQRRGRKEDDATSVALELMKVKRVPNVYTGLLVSSDSKGNNFTILQRHPMMDVTDIPLVQEALMVDDLKTLYLESDENDNVCDIIFEIGSFEKLPAHRLILANASHVFASILSKNTSKSIKVTNKLFSVDATKCSDLEDPKVFRAVLDMIYTRECYWVSQQFMEVCWASSKEEGKKKGSKYMELQRDLTRFKSLCRVLGLVECETMICRYMSDLDSQLDSILNANSETDVLPPLFKLYQYLNETSEVAFSLEAGKAFADVVIESTDKVVFSVSKCMLVARLEYFRSLFSTNWQYSQSHDIDTEGKEAEKMKIALPFSSKAISILLEWVYTNRAPLVKNADTELLCEALGCSDYVMSDNLLQICESEVISKMNMKNVVDILAFAWKHNGIQLKNTCFDFISLSLTAMLENKLLDGLPTKVLLELSEYYRQAQQNFRSLFRKLSNCYQAPEEIQYEEALRDTSIDILESLDCIEDADVTTVVRKNQNKTGKSRVRLRSRTYSESESMTEQKEFQAEGVPVNTSDDSMEQGSSQMSISKSPSSHPSCKTPPRSAAPSERKMSNGPQKKLIVPLPNNAFSSPDKNAEAKRGIKSEDFPALGFSSIQDPEPKISAPKKPNPAPASPVPTTSSPSTWKSPAPTASTPKVVSSSGKKKTKWRAIKSDADICARKSPAVQQENKGIAGTVKVGSPPTPNLTADGRDRNNPWKINSTKQESKVEFKTIVEDEVEKKKNFERATSKSLPMMQIEDEVINRLTERYSSEDTIDFIELLTVERVVTSNFSAPTWVQHPGALTAAFPVQQPIQPPTSPRQN